VRLSAFSRHKIKSRTNLKNLRRGRTMRRSSTKSFELAAKPACIAVLILSSGISFAQDDPVRRAPIVVTPNRVEQSSFDSPVSIDAFNKEQIQQGQSQVNLRVRFEQKYGG
jgi:hypothetical protein